jgi:sorbitol-specific phosphotransferase system component IIA
MMRDRQIRQVNDRQRRYRERLKAGRRIYRVELVDTDAEELVKSLGHCTDDMDLATAEVLQFFIELSKTVTRNDGDFADVLLCIAEAYEADDERQ